ncbi:MAG TPA: LLM class F420-dependent oxidoreductase [Acidimicrobiales bacterium]|jgi:probable F420-dependent oxidoreductase|nr:LLM class F420-dependent oxidoreductase [Acidimicrobiales bacterium]
MDVDGGIGFDPAGVVEAARLAEQVGYDGIWSAETSHDPFLPLALAAQATERIKLGTGIAVAFARNPMTLAMVANDLQTLSEGRFMLGLGSQIKPHIEKRFSMPWSHPAARMRELILAIRAIWASWSDGTRLAFRGQFYRHTLMNPMFDPGRNPFGNPLIFLAAVGEQMTEVAGEVADGLLAHGFTTERYLREVTLPALGRGLATSGRTRADVQISYPGMVVTGTDDAGFEKATRAVKAQLAFYGSTPAYRPVLALHGWGDLQAELNALSKRGAWEEMAGLIDDDMLHTFAVVGELDDIAGMVLRRFEGVVDRFNFYAPYAMQPERWAEVLAGFKQAA